MEARVPKTPDEWARALRRNTIRIDVPWDQLGSARRAWITLRCWVRRMRGYAVHHTSGGVYFDGPFRDARVDRRLWAAIMQARGYTVVWTRAGVTFEGPYRNQKLHRRIALTVLRRIVRLGGYSLAVGADSFRMEGPHSNLKVRQHIWFAVYVLYMRRRSYTFTYTRSGYSFDRAFSSRDRARRTEGKVAS